MKITLLILAALFVLSGCASMSKKDCIAADWLVQGIQDGRAGLPLSRLDSHAKACGKVNVVPDAPLYAEGHVQGVQHYCTPETGLYQGRQDNTYHGVCPPDLEPAFLTSYIDGLELYALTLETQNADDQSRLSRLRLRQAALGVNTDKKLLSDIAGVEASISTNTSKRLQIRQRIARLRLGLN